MADPTSPAVAVAGTGLRAPTMSYGGVTATPLRVVQDNEEAARAAEKAANDVQNSPLITGLAGLIAKHWSINRQAKKNTVEDRLYQSIRARRGEYDPDKLAQIQEMGGSQVYAGLTSTKCRAAGGWLRDVMLSTGAERPWAIRPTPVPELPPEVNDLIVQAAEAPIAQAMSIGAPINQQQIMNLMAALKDQAHEAIIEEATTRTERMADKMEDQLIEGGFTTAMDEFIDDITTFPTAILKGPVITKKPRLKWGDDNVPVVEDVIHMSWERVSPFDIYPSPAATNPQTGNLIQAHRLTRQDLSDMKGVDGYDDDAIDKVLREYNTGLVNWMFDKASQDDAEGKDTTTAYRNSDELIDAIQYWGSVQGQLLIDWGLKKEQVPDPLKEYPVEAWLIGPYVIKATLNYDPMRRKPYYTASYESVPGSFWGNSVADLVRDSQDVVNASARAMINNMALASGPQVAIMVDRLAAGEDITQMQPWKIWQAKSDPLAGSNQKPIEFFQPQSNVNELIMVYEKFSALADEFSGIPRYLTGDTTGGAGRTASGLSMLISNAGKSIKQVISNIDVGVMKPMLEMLYYHNMRYGEDEDLKGDVCIVARGASALIAKETVALRRNEFLMTTANPIDMQIVGMEGRAAVLRETARSLDMNVDKVVPSTEVLRQRAAALTALAPPAAPGGSPASPAGPSPSGQVLEDGTPITDNMSPPAQ